MWVKEKQNLIIRSTKWCQKKITLSRKLHKTHLLLGVVVLVCSRHKNPKLLILTTDIKICNKCMQKSFLTLSYFLFFICGIAVWCSFTSYTFFISSDVALKTEMCVLYTFAIIHSYVIVLPALIACFLFSILLWTLDKRKRTIKMAFWHAIWNFSSCLIDANLHFPSGWFMKKFLFVKGVSCCKELIIVEVQLCVFKFEKKIYCQLDQTIGHLSAYASIWSSCDMNYYWNLNWDYFLA